MPGQQLAKSRRAVLRIQRPAARFNLMLGHGMAPVMIASATLKADFADRSNQTRATARGQIPCSVPEIPCSAPRISLFRQGRENPNNANRLFSRKNPQEAQFAELEKKKKFPVPAQEQGNPATATRPDEARASVPALRESHPDSYQPIYAEQARKLCAHGLSETDVADFLNVTRATLGGWRRHYPDFAAALARGKAAADKRVELSLYQRACGYERQVEKIFTPARAEEPIRVKYRERVPADVRAGLAWLRLRRPEQWGNQREQARARRERLSEQREAAASIQIERHQRSDLDTVTPERVSHTRVGGLDQRRPNHRAGLAEQPHTGVQRHPRHRRKQEAMRHDPRDKVVRSLAAAARGPPPAPLFLRGLRRPPGAFHHLDLRRSVARRLARHSAAGRTLAKGEGSDVPVGERAAAEAHQANDR